MRYLAERASLRDGAVRWVVIDEDFELHVPATQFLRNLVDDRARSVGTARTYAGRVALFLTWCSDQGLDWAHADVEVLAHFRRWLQRPGGIEAEPSIPALAVGSARSGKTVRGYLSAVFEFLRFGARKGLVPRAVVDSLVEPRWIEEGRFDRPNRRQTSLALRVRAEEQPVEWLSDREVDALLAVCRSARDRFIVTHLRLTGERAGDALGTRLSDLHLLSDNRPLGCQTKGPHVHVVRRDNNSNEALAKGRRNRSVPVQDRYVDSYLAYRAERAELCGFDSDYMLVNIGAEPLGAPMTYGGMREMLQRLGRRTGIHARAHLLRHSFGTGLSHERVDLDVIRDLMGHAHLSSTSVYLHSDDERRRSAIERAQARQR